MIERDKIHARFKDAQWYKPQDIIIGGVGGIGSWVSLLLSRADHALYLFDFDTVGLENIGGQLYGMHHVGMKKTEAMKNIIREFSDNMKVETFEKYEEESMVGNIVFSCFDNMAARKLMVNKWYQYQMQKTKRDPKEVNVFIDGRLEAETFIIYVLRSSDNYKAYMDEFFDDSKIANAPCTFRATSHNAAIIAGNMVAVLNNLIANKDEGDEIREVPFKISYQLPTFTYSVQ